MEGMNITIVYILEWIDCKVYDRYVVAIECFVFFFTCVLQLGTLGLVGRLALFHHAVGLWAGGGSHGGGDILVQLPPRPPNITVC